LGCARLRQCGRGQARSLTHRARLLRLLLLMLLFPCLLRLVLPPPLPCTRKRTRLQSGTRHQQLRTLARPELVVPRDRHAGQEAH
jgi:hypothetical protein